MDSTEAYLIEFDPTVITYEDILDKWAATHAPFYPSKCQYRSAIFYSNGTQRDAAKSKVEELGNGGRRKVYVDIEPVSAFYRAEEYHQDFMDKQMSSSAI